MSATATYLTQEEQATIMALVGAKDRIKAEMDKNMYVKQCLDTCTNRGLSFEDSCIILAAYSLDRIAAMEEVLNHNAAGIMHMQVILSRYQEEAEKAK